MSRRLSLAILALCLALPAPAVTISVAPCMDPALADPDLTALLVDGAMDGLFDEGFIATNVPAQSLGLSDWRACMPDFREAKTGSVDYYLEIYVAYSPASADAAANPASGQPAIPSDVEYRLYSVQDGSLRASASLVLPKAKPLNSEDIRKMARELGRSAAKGALAILSGKSDLRMISAYIYNVCLYFPGGKL